MPSNMVPFGKYKGQPVEALAADRDYCDWLAAQPWFRDRFRDVYNVIIQTGGEPQDSPEHNALQARFLDDAFCLALWRALEPHRAPWRDFREQMVTELRMRLNLAVMDDTAANEAAAAEGGGRGEKARAWLAAAEAYKSSRRFWSRTTRWEVPWIAARKFESQGVDVVVEATFAADCSAGFDEKFETGEYRVERHGWVALAIECKPAIGDDYPSVLRQVQRARTEWRKVVVTGAYTGTGATLEQVRAIYAASDAALVLLEDIKV